MADAWVEAAVEAGLERNDDFNGAAQDGVGRYQVTQRNGMRCSTAVAFLHPGMDRPNLTVETRTQVHRILLEGTRAIGVVAERGGELVELRAEREVMLCRRRLQLAAAPAPVRHRARRGARAARDRVGRRPARGRPQPPGPRADRRHLDHRGAGLADPRRRARVPGGVRGARRGPAHVERRRERRLLALDAATSTRPTSSSTARP